MSTSAWTEAEWQERCGRLVEIEVSHCVSALVEYVLANDESGELLEGFEGFYVRECPSCGEDVAHDAENDCDDEHGFEAWECPYCEKHVDLDNADTRPQEVYEYWIVSEWLASKLAARGCVIHRDFFNLPLWGRCATGQAIKLDAVIRDVVRELHEES